MAIWQWHVCRPRQTGNLNIGNSNGLIGMVPIIVLATEIVIMATGMIWQCRNRIINHVISKTLIIKTSIEDDIDGNIAKKTGVIAAGHANESYL